MSLHEPIIDTSMSTLADHALETSSKAMNRFCEDEISARVSMNRRELENVMIDLREMWRDLQMRPLVKAEFVPIATAYAELGELLREIGADRGCEVLEFPNSRTR